MDAMVCLYYQTLFREENTKRTPSGDNSMFPSRPPEKKRFLTRLFSDNEVKAALFEISPFKAPGTDGLHAGFYQNAWETVSTSLCKSVISFLNSRNLPTGVNDTLIALNRKVPHSKAINQFRPISLYNVRYKVIMKTITNRLKEIMNHIVNPNQSSFVPRR